LDDLPTGGKLREVAVARKGFATALQPF